MKKLLIGISVICFLLSGSFVFAEMNGVIKADQKSGMSHGQMMGDMMGLSNQMSEMMREMSNHFKDMPAGDMEMMSSVMKDMSEQMIEMSKAMASGKPSIESITKIQNKMQEIQQSMSGMGCIFNKGVVI